MSTRTTPAGIPRFADPASRIIAKGEAAMAAFAATRRAPRGAVTTKRQQPTAPAKATGSEYPAHWTDAGTHREAEAVASSGAGVDYPAHWAY
jgi:hypothetical protein